MDDIQDLGTAERRLFIHAREKNIPINGSMELLPLCNMNCDMCYVRLTRHEMEKQGRMRTGSEWLALGREMVDAGVMFLLLTGGEPLMHPDFKEIYLGLKKMGLVLTVNTNGTLIDEEWADFFAKHKPRRINITLYGADEKAYQNLCHYSCGFDRTVNAVHLLRRRNVDVRLGCTLTDSNEADIDRLFDIAVNLGVPMRMDPYVMPAIRERDKPFEEQDRMLPERAAKASVLSLRHTMGDLMFEEYRRLMIGRVDAFQEGVEQLCENGCHAGRCSFTINWQGKMCPCVVSSEPSADVFEMGFEAAWRHVSSEFQAIRYCSQCSNCRLRPVCRTCALACLLETGDYLGRPDYLCRFAAETERLLRLSREGDHHE